MAETKESQAAVIRLSYETLAQVMNLPYGVRITGMSYDAADDSAAFRIEGDGLPLVREGELLSQFRPECRKLTRLNWKF